MALAIVLLTAAVPAAGSTSDGTEAGRASPSDPQQTAPDATQAAPKATADSQSAPSKAKDDQKATDVNLITGFGATSAKDYRPLTGKQRWALFANQTVASGGAYFGPVASSIVDQIDGNPPEWGGGLGGYGRRLASRIGTGIVQATVQAGGCAVLGQDPRYIRSAGQGAGNRSLHALLFSFVTYDKRGKRRPAIPTLASYYASGMISTLWFPERYTALGDGVRDGNQQLIFSILLNQFQEFLPEIRRVVFRKK